MSSEASPNEGATDGTTTDPGVVYNDNDVNMGRCAELQAEWNELREEQGKLAKDMGEAAAPTEEQVVRNEQISARLKAITAEMTQVLERAQEKLPHPDDTAEDAPARSKTGKHRLERTYESTDSEGPPDNRTSIDYPKVYDEARPSESSKSTKNTTSSSNRTVTTTLGQKLRSTLRTAQNSLTGSGSLANATLSAAEREKLKAEESRLERELFEFGEKASLDEAEEKRVTEVTARLKEIADLNLDATPAALADEKGQQPLPKRNKSMMGNRNKFAAKAKAFVSNVSSPRHRPSAASKPTSFTNADPPTADVTDATAPDVDSAAARSGAGGGNNASTSAAATSKDKDKEKEKEKKSAISKRWGTLKKHVTKLSGGGSKSSASSPAASTQKTESPSSVKVEAATAASSGNEYTEVRDRLAQRGEKLSGLGKDAAEMREGATDMLAAAKALRKKNEKRNIF